MTRSKDALQRRAAKRGLPVPELVRADGAPKKNTTSAKKLIADKNSKPESSSKRPTSSSSIHWHCSMCKNRNITSLAPTCCNRCQRERKEVDETFASKASEPAAKKTRISNDDRSAPLAAPSVKVRATSSSIHWHCSMCKNRNITSLAPTCCNRCQRERKEVEEVISTPDDAPTNLTKPSGVQKPAARVTTPAQKLLQESRAWRINAPSQADLLKNESLREAYLDEEKRAGLSEEDKARAEILVARSKRKKEKKQEMKQAGYRFTSSKKNNYTNRSRHA